METSSYSEARAEYQKQMANKLVGPLLAYFRKMRSDLWAESQTSILQRFQRKCSEVPKWNQDVVVDETGRLIESSGCDYLEELMTALFIVVSASESLTPTEPLHSFPQMANSS
jgi:hypothetical protein